MADPEIQTPPEFQFYVQQNGIRKTQREFERDSLPGLRKSLSTAHDNLQRQVGINTRLYASLLAAQRSLGSVKLALWITSAAVVAQWGIMLVFLDHLLR